MKKRSLFLILLLAVFMPWAAMAQTLTVYDDESATNRFVPIDGYNVDGTSIKSEYIMPAEELTAMNGKEITKMTLYLQTVGNRSWGNATFRVFMKEVQTTTISSFTGYSDATVVYVGGLDCLNEEMEVTFTEKYTYNGGNLLIGFYIITSGSYTGSYNDYKPLYYGEAVTGASIGGTSATQQNFLPKTTFTYQNAASCPKPSGLAVNGLTATWNAGTASQWNLKYKKTSASTWTPVNGLTTASYPFSGLEAQADYEVQVQSDCGGGDLSEWTSSVNFTAPCDAITTFPWSEDFEDFTANTVPECWDNSTSTSSDATANPHYIWGVYSYNSNKMLRMYNFYAHTGTALINSQPITLPATGEYELSFDYAHNATCGAFLVKISENGGEFVQKGSYTKGNGSSSTDPGEFTQADPISLASYAGKTIIVQFYANANYGSGAIFVDNVKIALPPTCQKPTDLECTGTTATKATLRWTNGAASQTAWQICLNGDEDHLISANSNPFTISTGLTPATTYTAKVRAYCSETDQSEWSNTISFTTDCPDSYPLDYTCGFEGPNTTTNPLPLCWTRMGSHTTYPNVSTSQHHGEGTRSLYFYKSSSTTYNNVIAALPAIDAEMNTVRVVFYGKLSSASTDGTINVGYVTSLTDATTFQSVETVTLTTDWEKYTISFGNVGNVSGNIAFQALYSTASASIYIDDVLVEEIPDCLEPTDLAEVANTATTNSVTFGWTAVNNETTWKVQYKKSDATDWTTVSDPVTTNPYTLPGLDHSSTYQVRVAAWCTPSNPEGISEYCEPITVQTKCDANTVDAGHHFMEDFNDYTPGSTSTSAPSNYPDDELPLCWRFLNRSENSNTYPMVFLSSSSDYTVSGNCLFFKSSSETPIYAVLPEFTNNISDLMLTFTYRNEGTSTSNGTLYVSYMTNPADATTFNTEHAIACEKTTTKTEKEVFFDNAPAGSYIAFKYEGGTGNNMYLSIDNVEVELAPSCRKPSGLTKDATTAHTATLHWTNGEEGQNAWQIAYSTTADFNPDEVTPVDVTTNPVTIEGLTQSTTYYAYVRAYCGGTDYSKWCNTKVNFTTPAGNVTPTGLTVNASTITSNQATASWNAVAGNTLHQSYDIYWDLATVTSVPAEPAAPNLISGITATSQDITGLNPETSYKVWVRDNCGTDGLSAWSTAVTFTTAADCQTPDGLAASNVTNESATISWNTYGLTDFNLQYRISGEEWDANNIIPNVNTPYTLNPPLVGSTTYEVRVQAACTTDDSWSDAVSFKTKCDHVSFPWSENFDDWESKSECWSFLSGAYNNGNGPATTYSSAWTLNSSYGSYITLSGKALTMNLYSSNKYWAVTPIIDITTDDALLTVDVAVSAWSSATPNFDNNDTLAFAISTNGGATFTSLRVLDGAELNTLGNNYTTIYVPVTGYNGQAVRFAIFGGSINNVSSNDNRCVIDNVTVIETPSCYPVGTLSAATDVTYNSAKLSWTLVDDTQDEWTVQYATNATFTEGVETKTATTNTNYELTGLTPETHYWVRVKAACSTTDDWSNAIDFETEVFCAVSVPTAANITQTTADLSWTGASDSYNVQYRIASPGMNELWFEGFENETAYNQWTLNNCVSGSTRSTDAKRTDDYGFKFAYNSSYSGITPPQYLISPDLSAYTTNDVTVEFYYKKSSTWNETFNVGWSSTTNSTDAFTWDDHGDYSATQLWQAYTHTIPAGTKYVAIAYTADNQLSMYIDDFTIGAPIAAGTWQNATSETASKQLTGLAAGTKYDVQVQGVCGGDAGNWSESINFTTLPFTKEITGYGTDNNVETGWNLIASPVTSVTPSVDNGFLTNTYDLYYFDQTGGDNDMEWKNYKQNSFDLVSGKGYLYANSNNVTLTFIGEPYSGNGEFDLVYDNSANDYAIGCNLVGNPFPTEAYASMSYYTMNEAGTGLVSTAVSTATPIPPCTGIFVEATEAGQKVTFSTTTPSGAAHNNGNLQMNLAQSVTSRGDINMKTIDNVIVSFNEGDNLSKFDLFENNAKLYIPQGTKDYAIVGAEAQGEMPVNFKANQNGNYTITVSPNNVDMAYLHLIDNMTGNDVDLLVNPSYSFNATTNDYESRFKLVFATGATNDSETFAFYSNGNWIISNIGEATLQVIDINGRILSSETINGSVSKAINQPAGIYMIRLINGENVMVQKVVVR